LVGTGLSEKLQSCRISLSGRGEAGNGFPEFHRRTSKDSMVSKNNLEQQDMRKVTLWTGSLAATITNILTDKNLADSINMDMTLVKLTQ
jgi:hypothetical protein